jgi:phosphonate transport system substrate-binding protein
MSPDIFKRLMPTLYYSRILALLLPPLLLLSGCVMEETPKKVSLNTRSSETMRDQTLKEREEIEKNTLRFGFDLRLGPKEDIRIYTPFLNYLEETTGINFRIKFTEKYEDTIENLGNGIIHFAAIGSLSYVIGREKFKIRCIASGLNEEGNDSYHAMIFTRPGSGIQKLQDLRGKNFAFGSIMSTQGHLIPRKMLEDAGVMLHELSYYVFTGSHIETARVVINGEYDAGGIQGSLAKRLEEEGKIKIIQVSEPYPSSLICYNTALDDTLVRSVREALISFSPRGEHRDMLYNWEKTEMPLGFTDVNESGIEEVAYLARKYDLIRK